MAGQAVECLLCKHKTLSSNSSPTKKKKKASKQALVYSLAASLATSFL
jgi:hypothetical protein